jgi:hypothetical protein
MYGYHICRNNLEDLNKNLAPKKKKTQLDLVNKTKSEEEKKRV